MALHVPPQVPGLPEPEDDPDPMRRANAQFVDHLAFVLETSEQLWEAAGEAHAEYERRIEALERSVAVLESLVVGETPEGAR